MSQVYDTAAEVTRRDFLVRGGSLATVMGLLGGVELRAADLAPATEPSRKSSPPVKLGVIGLGLHGRDIVNTLGRLPNAPVVAVCDHYEPMIKRARESAPNAQAFADYRQLLAIQEVEAVVVATPSHQHTAIVLAALQAGKHVYCEAPLATTTEDARAIARAARDHFQLNFQAGLHWRSDRQRQFTANLLQTGVTGKTIKARAQFHKKQSWARTSPNPDREKEVNWRLRRESSAGILGELGIHSLDTLVWFLQEMPQAVSGFGSLMLHTDGREVPDTVQAVFEFPGGALLSYEGSLGNSFEAEHEILYGADAAILLRGQQGWLFKEPDAPLLGWEAHAKKEDFYSDTGIVLRADATRLAKAAGDLTAPPPAWPTPLQQALEAFVYNSDLVKSAVEDFKASFTSADARALRDFLSTEVKNKLPAATCLEGYVATVLAIKANEAVLKGQKLALGRELFQV
jgi:predicted dehydrogenase